MKNLNAILSVLTFLLYSSTAFATARNLLSRDVGEYKPFDQIGAVNYPVVKLSTGAAGTATPVSSANPLPISNVSRPVVQFMDTALMDTSSTTINGSGGAIVTVVASLNQAITAVTAQSTCGDFIGVYEGATLRLILGPGEDGTFDMSMANAAAVGVRSMSSSSITVGKLALQFR